MNEHWKTLSPLFGSNYKEVMNFGLGRSTLSSEGWNPPLLWALRGNRDLGLLLHKLCKVHIGMYIVRYVFLLILCILLTLCVKSKFSHEDNILHSDKTRNATFEMGWAGNGGPGPLLDPQPNIKRSYNRQGYLLINHKVQIGTSTQNLVPCRQVIAP